MFGKLIPHLRKKPGVGRVIAVDLAGHGARTDVKPMDEIRLSNSVEDVVGATGIVSFDAGHSAFASRPQELSDLLSELGGGDR